MFYQGRQHVHIQPYKQIKYITYKIIKGEETKRWEDLERPHVEDDASAGL